MAARSRPPAVRRSPWWGVGLLSLAVAASSFAVPALLPGGGSPVDGEGRAAASSSTITSPAAPTATVPVTTPATTTATPAATTPEVTTPEATPETTTRSPTPEPSFEAMTINPWAKKYESSGIAVIDCPTCASGRRVQYLGQGHYVIVRLADVPVAGRRTMTVIYTCACDDDPRDLDVMVNSDPVRTFTVKGAKSWETPARFSMRIRLEKGANVIRFSNQDDPAPDLDQILIR
ncbi:hypothetical protein KIH74_25535 [Kineosporia sp. J2-2]|uniref:CBM6 domain-containing protein n=1 Tax=Kineosporia corallincola TaxID=2835133 RepID=A0ABS5TQI8_9ACTN|nr:hypothetical protein [Kineosporia corallincola]MBT0772333.1 hypothetical protein [Kineosporia corallincola]